MSDETMRTSALLAPMTITYSTYYGNVLLLAPSVGYSPSEDGAWWDVIALGSGSAVNGVFVSDEESQSGANAEGMPERAGSVIADIIRTSTARRNSAWDAESKLSTFKESARETLIDAWKGHFQSSTVRYCDEFNDLLRALGMEEHFGTHSVSVTITADVAADDEDEAYSILRDAVRVSDSRVSNEDVE